MTSLVCWLVFDYNWNQYLLILQHKKGGNSGGQSSNNLADEKKELTDLLVGQRMRNAEFIKETYREEYGGDFDVSASLLFIALLDIFLNKNKVKPILTAARFDNKIHQ